MITKSDFQNANRELLAEARRTLGEPPTAEEMLALSEGTLSESEAERVRDRMAAYPELARMYGEPVPDEPRPGDADYLTDEDVASGWEALQRKLPRVAAEAPRGRLLAFRAVPARYVPTAVAAALALVFAGLFLQANVRARRFQQELERPLVVGEAIELSPTDGQRGGTQPPKEIVPDGDAYHLVPALNSQLYFAHYRIDLADLGNGKVLWSNTAVRRQSDSTFDLIVPRRRLPAGRYQLRIYGLDGAREERLSVYDIHVAE